MSLDISKVKNGGALTVRYDGEYYRAVYLNKMLQRGHMVRVTLPNGESKFHLAQPHNMFVEGITSDRGVRDVQREQARQQASASDSEEESDNLVDDTTTISHISAHKSGSAWKYKVRDSLSGNWSYKEPKDIGVLYKCKVLMDARKTPGVRVSVITGCGADDIAAKDDAAGGSKEESDDSEYTDAPLGLLDAGRVPGLLKIEYQILERNDFVRSCGNVTTFDDAAGGGPGRSSAMVDGDACTQQGQCSSDSTGEQLGSLNASDGEEESPSDSADSLNASGSEEERDDATGTAGTWNPPTSKDKTVSWYCMQCTMTKRPAACRSLLLT